MSEFKGTKGKWFACCNKTNPHFLFNEEGNTCIAGFYQKQEMINDLSDEEFKANALLISKAPEMLEMLKSFVDSCCGEQEYEEELIKGLGHELYNNVLKAKQLIKQATEI